MGSIEKIPENIARSIELQAIALKRADLGWRPILKLIKRGCNFVKRTSYSQALGMKFGVAKSVDSFYSEDEQLFVWTHRSPMFRAASVYVYGNPFQRSTYDFGFEFME